MSENLKQELIEFLVEIQGDDTYIMNQYYKNKAKKLVDSINFLEAKPKALHSMKEDENDFRCGQGDNRCNCLHTDDCGYVFIYSEVRKL